MWQLLIAGFTIGCTSSFHCIGMCGPLSLALPVRNLPTAMRELALILYNAGRLVTYSLLGFFFGMLGRTTHIAGLQQVLSIGLGLVLLISALYLLVTGRKLQPSYLNPLNSFVYRKMHLLLQQQTMGSYLLLGIMNGLLPCGMVYLALAFAASLPQIGESVAVMLAFGAGTLPAMLAVGYAGLSANTMVRKYIRRATPFIVVACGSLLILRGMNLDIPFISPLIHTHQGTIVSCHE